MLFYIMGFISMFIYREFYEWALTNDEIDGVRIPLIDMMLKHYIFTFMVLPF